MAYWEQQQLGITTSESISYLQPDIGSVEAQSPNNMEQMMAEISQRCLLLQAAMGV